MEGLILFCFLLIIAGLIVLIIMVNTRFNRFDKKLNDLNRRVMDSKKALEKQIDWLYNKQRVPVSPDQHVSTEESTKVAETRTIVPEVLVPDPVQELQTNKAEESEIQKEESVDLESELIKKRAAAIPSNIKPKNTPVFEAPKSKAPEPKPKKPSFWERNPDLEKFIGENLVSKIGIALFVIGMGFLVKLGIDKGVINQQMRVVIGLATGGGMIGLAHYLRKSFKAFSSILIGGGLAVLYFTIGLAHKEYALFPHKMVPFILMVAITGFAILLALAYDRIELAVVAVIGGFATPIIVSDGTGSHIDLFTYILVLDIGMLLLVYFKKWNLINYISYVFTYLLFAALFADRFLGHEEEYRLGFFLFLTAFYLIFFLMSIVYNVRNNRPFRFMEVGILLTNSGIYFGLGLGLIHGYQDGTFDGLFTALIAIFNVIFVFILFRRKNIDTNLLYLLVGLVLTFASLIGPIQLEGNYITLFWSVEAVLLLWLAQKSGIKLIRLASVLVNMLMLISLTMDWEHYYISYHEWVLDPLINKAFVASMVSAVSLIFSRWLIRKEASEHFVYGINTNAYLIPLEITGLLVLFQGIFLEFNYQLVTYEVHYAQRAILLGVYVFLYVLVLTLLSRWKKKEGLHNFLFYLTIPLLISYLTYFLRNIIDSRNTYLLDDSVNASGFIWHYALFALFIVLLILQMNRVHTKFSFKSVEGKIALWALSLIGVIVLSTEVTHLAIVNLYVPGLKSINEIHQGAVRSVYPVVWGVSAFLLMAFGMKFKIKTLRLSSLVLFFVTLLKLGLWDLKGSDTGRVIALIVLGLILLIVSFLYQKLKFIVQDDEGVEPKKREESEG